MADTKLNDNFKPSAHSVTLLRRADPTEHDAIEPDQLLERILALEILLSRDRYCAVRDHRRR